MFSDPATVLGALAGAVVAVAVVVRFGWWRAPEEPVPVSPPRSVPTEYKTSHAPSPAPILTAVGAALVAIGLTFSSYSLILAIGTLLVGGVLISAAVVSALRGHGEAASEPDGEEGGGPEQPG